MSSADKRSPSTDALETLGMIHFKPEHRDAIHLAVEAVKAVDTFLDSIGDTQRARNFSKP